MLAPWQGTLGHWAMIFVCSELANCNMAIGIATNACRLMVEGATKPSHLQYFI
jgi:hypothetical protein